MPPEMAVSMRHTKLKREEAALLAGELTKPNWESRNEGIHERVSFEDTIWGFDLAGGSFYKTPLRVTYVKADSRAAKAGIRPGDRLKRINDIDTSTLTIQEAHDIIVESGIHLKLAVTAPEDEEDAYYCYEDPIDDGYDSEEERRLAEEKARKRQVHARVSSYWSLQWPWVSKRRIIYRESNCFLVPSKFEEKHRDKFPILPMNRIAQDLVMNNLCSLEMKSPNDGKTELQRLQERQNPAPVDLNNTPKENGKNVKQPVANDGGDNTVGNGQVDKEETPKVMNGHLDNVEAPKETNGHLDGIVEEDEKTSEVPSKKEESIQDISESEGDSIIENNNIPIVDLPEEKALKNIDVQPQTENESIQDISESEGDSIVENSNVPIVDLPEEKVLEKVDVQPHTDDEVIEELLNGEDETVQEDEEKVIDSILSEDNSLSNDVANGG